MGLVVKLLGGETLDEVLANSHRNDSAVPMEKNRPRIDAIAAIFILFILIFTSDAHQGGFCSTRPPRSAAFSLGL